MTAKEMFEKLGYIYSNYHTYICCTKEILEDYIYFYKDDKTIEITHDITFEELQAINKQCEELGWK